MKYLCVPCNTGWLSNLETQARQVLGPLIHDLSIPLSRAQQQLIAVWSVKTAMVFECTNPTKNWFYSRSERHQLRLEQRLPADTLVWIGRYTQSQTSYAIGRLLGVDLEHDGSAAGGYVTTLALGHVVLQVLTVRRRPGYEAVKITLHARAGPWRDTLSQIWSTRSALVGWPPLNSFNEHGLTLDELSERFVRRR